MKKFYFLVMALGLFTSINAQIINFIDSSFKGKLLSASTSNGIAKNLTGNYFKIDSNNDGEIEVLEASQVSELDVTYANISSLIGIEQFINLNKLYCNNNQILNLDLSWLINLRYLNCSYNPISNLNLNGLSGLESLYFSGCQLINLDVTSLTNLQFFECINGQLVTLNLAGLTYLKHIDCAFNNITNLNVSNTPSLEYLSCTNNQLTTLNFSSSINLIFLYCAQNFITNLNFIGINNIETLHCFNNKLTSIDVSNLNLLHTFWVGLDPMLETIYMKNGSNESSLNIDNSPNLRYICADESEISNVQNSAYSFGSNPNCTISSYCSFTPGGTFYTIQGSNKYDGNNNGCDALDLGLPNLKFDITDGTNSGSLISNTTGSYSIPVQAGMHTLTPVLENPTYFTISPASSTVNFPTQTSPFTQNFCITANGVHPDLEITLLPITAARPGFDATYKIIYKNKGNTTQSGTVNLTFNDAVLDLVSTNPVVTNQTINNLSWNFTNLVPFETREVSVILNVNSPMETPAVNNGDILNYSTSISSVATDDLPSDNTFVFNQTVVNSFDPNDKICLQGATIPPSKVGDYVHYRIRFENNGTANAQNIVVKDMIDLSKLDISTLVPIKGSHSFVTNISSGNKVEFIFENINLPFDDANNDGYVAFKIKTKPTLVLGDTFSNTASIYFDYNFPIVTNTATTTIAALATKDFAFENYFSLYPNPVSNFLNITVNESIKISSINIYNTLGQLVLVIPNVQETKIVDVSSLSSGNYFIKIHSDKGTSNKKFVKI